MSRGGNPFSFSPAGASGFGITEEWNLSPTYSILHETLLLQSNTVSPVSLHYRGWSLTAVLLNSLSWLYLVPCVTKGTCTCPALSRALGGCTNTHTHMHAHTCATHRSRLTVLQCWQRGILTTLMLNFSPLRAKMALSPSAQREENTLKVMRGLLGFFCLVSFFSQQVHYSVTASVPCESNLQAQ